MIHLVDPEDQKDNLFLFLKKNKNANDSTSDLCGNSNIVGENATMGQSRASENIEGENSNVGESVVSFKVVRAVRRRRGRGKPPSASPSKIVKNMLDFKAEKAKIAQDKLTKVKERISVKPRKQRPGEAAAATTAVEEEEEEEE